MRVSLRAVCIQNGHAADWATVTEYKQGIILISFHII